MGEIRIIRDSGNVYQNGEIVSVADFIQSWTDCTDDQGTIDFVWRIPIPSAVDFIADAWGIEYEFV